MGVREIDRSLEQMADGSQGLAAAVDSGSQTPGAGAVVGHPAPGAGLDRLGHGGGTGTGPAHHRTLGVGLRRGRTCGPDLRADRGFPPALDQAQQEELKEAVEQPPATSGIGLANWYWKVVRQFVAERFGIGLSRSSCLNYLHRLGVCLQAPQEAAAQGGCGQAGGLCGGVRRAEG